MRNLIVILASFGFNACATNTNKIFDERYSRFEVASLTAKHFKVSDLEVQRALKPTFKKYGRPHGYIDGLMSSIDEPEKNLLYGSGFFRTKLNLKKHTFWRVDGDRLAGHFTPIKTAHLVYDIVRLDPLSKSFEFSESLTKQGQKFSIFEHKVDNKIVITVHSIDELEDTQLDRVSFFSE